MKKKEKKKRGSSFVQVMKSDADGKARNIREVW